MSTVKVIYVPAGRPNVAVVMSIPRDLGAFQALVGGYVERIPTTETGVSIFLNEEGKFFADPILNEAATRIQKIGYGLLPGDYIVGDVVIVGPPDMEGETLDIPQDAIDLCRAAGVRVYGADE